MKDYRHMMRQVTLSDEKKEKIMELLENGSEQKRRHIPKAARIALAAALVLVCMMSVAAASDLLPMRFYDYFTVIPGKDAGLIGETSDGAEFIVSAPSPEDDPLVLEDGRLWFVGGGERTDVTDLIDENTPYIYECTDPDTGIRGWFILGGTPEDFGWAVCSDIGGGFAMTGHNFGRVDSTPSWLVSAMEQLGIEHY